MIQIKVPARVCFFGDHQDYLSLPVIAGAINRYINLEAIPNQSNSFKLDLLDINEVVSIAIDEDGYNVKNGDFLRASLAVLKQKGLKFQQGYSIKIWGDIPVNAGLSSSSALTIAWIRFLVAIQEKPLLVSDFEIGHWAYEVEVEYFNNPGGLMDQYTIAQQDLIYIDTATGKSEVLAGNLGQLVVAESGLKKQTMSVLKNGRFYQENAIKEVQQKNPNFNILRSTLEDYERFKYLVSKEYQNHWYAAIHNYHLTKRAKKLLGEPNSNLEELATVMNAHQKILYERIQNTPEKMHSMMQAALEAGAIGTKTIGSGGGGCMVAMVNSYTKDDVIAAFKNAGAKNAYEVTLTKKG